MAGETVPTTPTTTPSTIDQIVDSLKAPFVDASKAPAAKPMYTAIGYGIIGFLIGRAL